MILEFSGPVWYWKGPAPWYFVAVPDAESARIQEVSAVVTYGWGMIPVGCEIGRTTWTTALWPKDGRYVVPLKAGIRRAEGIAEGDTVSIRLSVGA